MSEIASRVRKSKDTVRSTLVNAGVELRPKISNSETLKTIPKGKTQLTPPYGFCYFQGKVVPDQREYNAMLLIHQLWKLGTNPNRIADLLNKKKMTPRRASAWNRNSVNKILERFADGTVVFMGGSYKIQ